MAKKAETISLIDTFAEFKETKNIDRATLVSVLEGGYSIGSLARSAVTHLQALLRTPEPS